MSGVWPRGAVAAGVAMLGACSSGGVDRPPINEEPDFDSQEPQVSAEQTEEWPEGVYLGSIESEITGETHELVALSDSWGITRWVTRQGQIHSGVGIASVGNSWVDGSTVAEFLIDRPGPPMSGSWSGAGDEGEWSLTLQPQMREGPLDGVYVLRDDFDNTVASFQLTDGAILYGSNTDGCVFSGSLTRDYWNFNYIYDVSLTVESCPDTAGASLNGEYLGEAGYTDSASGERRDLVIGVDDGLQAILLDIERL